MDIRGLQTVYSVYASNNCLHFTVEDAEAQRDKHHPQNTQLLSLTQGFHRPPSSGHRGLFTPH